MFKTIFMTSIALIAFAGNSILCRLALQGSEIDAASFTVIRLFSGSVMLVFLVAFMKSQKHEVKEKSGLKQWLPPLMLFTYATSFSYAYLSLETGIGALILFAFVQLGMLGLSIYYGERLAKTEWIGIAFAFGGLTYLLLPGASSPSIFGTTLMAISGLAWAVYTYVGKGVQNPLRQTSFNFVYTLPFVIGLAVAAFGTLSVTSQGAIYAILSGAVTSGLGYAIWYAALRNLSSSVAASLQLLVPILAALGGVLFAEEVLTLRLVVAGLMILGGIGLVIFGRNNSKR
ncbi:DMT family transporter [Pseudoalteromonas xiamenensis]